MRLDGQLPDQLMRIADAGFHTPETGLRQIFVIISAAAAHTRSGGGKSHSRNDDEVDVRRIARPFRSRRLGDSESAPAQLSGHIVVKPHRIALDPRHDDALCGAPPRQRRTGLRLVGQRAEKRRAAGLRKSGQTLHPAEDTLRRRGTLFGREREVPFFHRSAQFFLGHKIPPFRPKIPARFYCYSANNGYLCVREHKTLTNINKFKSL